MKCKKKNTISDLEYDCSTTLVNAYTNSSTNKLFPLMVTIFILTKLVCVFSNFVHFVSLTNSNVKPSLIIYDNTYGKLRLPQDPLFPNTNISCNSFHGIRPYNYARTCCLLIVELTTRDQCFQLHTQPKITRNGAESPLVPVPITVEVDGAILATLEHLKET